jgi:hypothetical protein
MLSVFDSPYPINFSMPKQIFIKFGTLSLLRKGLVKRYRGNEYTHTTIEELLDVHKVND